jgi:hypothetical protein
MPVAIALESESLSSLQEDEWHHGLQSDLVEKVSERSVRFAFFCTPAAL